MTRRLVDSCHDSKGAVPAGDLRHLLMYLLLVDAALGDTWKWGAVGAHLLFAV